MTFTYDETLRAARAVVEEFGEDYVYLRTDRVFCFYIYNSKPSCIVAQVVSRMLPSAEFKEGKDPRHQPWTHLFSAKAIVFLGCAQAKQDNEETWSAAVNYAAGTATSREELDG